jgi:uncharacterized membrane protein (DUF373 family)
MSSGHQLGASEQADTSSFNKGHNGTHEPEHPLIILSSRFLDQGDSFIYAIVGMCFFLGAIFTLGYSFWDFGSTILNVQGLVDAANHAKGVTEVTTSQSIVASAIIKLVSDLLLVLIIMEVLGTVIHYLKSHATSLRPFLFIGIVSATRGILSIGARLSVKEVSGPAFTNAMIELAVSGGVILALGITLKLLGKLVDD